MVLELMVEPHKFFELGYIKYMKYLAKKQSEADRKIVDLQHAIEFEYEVDDSLLRMTLLEKRDIKRCISFMSTYSTLFLELEKLDNEAKAFVEKEKTLDYSVKVLTNELGEKLIPAKYRRLRDERD